MDDGNVHALALEAIGGFQPEKTGADDDGATLALGDRQHLRHIVEIAVGEHARQLMAGNRNDERQRTGGDHQPVVGNRDAVFAGHGLSVAVDAGDLRTLVQRHIVSRIPFVIMNDDVFIALFARKHRREHDAVVIDARLRVKNGDVVKAGSGFEQVLQHAPRRHAIADDDEFLRHGRYSAASTKR